MIKQKKCKVKDMDGVVCNTLFTPRSSTQVACSLVCALHKNVHDKMRLAAKSATAQRVEHRAAKEKAKTRGDWTKEAQAAFNAYIRARDVGRACVSCGRNHQGQWHAGHYRAVGANPELRFNEFNVWKQCAPCNDHLHGNLINYRIELLKRIGPEKVDWLEGSHKASHLSIDDLKAIKAEYKLKLKDLENGRRM